MVLYAPLHVSNHRQTAVPACTAYQHKPVQYPLFCFVHKFIDVTAYLLWFLLK